MHGAYQGVYVSTHAPAKGATWSAGIDFRRWITVSTHAPAKGATPANIDECYATTMFQPTRPRRARLSGHPDLMLINQFQPTHPRRARQGKPITIGHTMVFQPTRPRRARHRLALTTAATALVSTHAPAKGATSIPEASRAVPSTFQPTRPRRARPSRLVNV